MRPLRKLLTALAVAAIGTAGYLYARPEPSPGPTASGAAEVESEAVPVTVAAAVRKPFPVALTVIGNVEAYSTVAIKSRVDGEILSAGFKEGQTVHKGDLLFSIDPRPFEAALRQAEANLSRDKAQLEGAKLDLDRYSKLAKSGFGTQQKYEESQTAVDALQATIQADQAAIETAKLNLSYTEIRAPIEGRTGSVLIHPGNLVKANDTNPLVVINQVRPIYVSFAVPEQYLPEIDRRMSQGPVRVEVRLADEHEPPATGRLSFVNNAVDASTGTIQLKATFPNDDGWLVPGAFVHVRLVLKTIENAVVVPTPAIQAGQDGSYVYVVDADGTAARRVVTGLVEAGDETAVETGLEAGDRVVTDGQLRLRPGIPVTPRPASAAGAEPPS